MKKRLRNRYRIVTDAYCGYEVQIKRWWFPFCWLQCGACNTHVSVDKAREYAKRQESRVVEELP